MSNFYELTSYILITIAFTIQFAHIFFLYFLACLWHLQLSTALPTYFLRTAAELQIAWELNTRARPPRHSLVLLAVSAFPRAEARSASGPSWGPAGSQASLWSLGRNLPRRPSNLRDERWLPGLGNTLQYNLTAVRCGRCPVAWSCQSEPCRNGREPLLSSRCHDGALLVNAMMYIKLPSPLCGRGWIPLT